MLSELGFSTRRVGEELHGRVDITPHMHVPGTGHLRTAILATWADTLTGLLAAQATTPQVPVTLELDVQLYRPAPGSGPLHAVASILKQGRSVFVAVAEFSDEQGLFAVGAASFMTSRDPAARLPAKLSLDAPPPEARLQIPVAERAGIRRLEPGVAALPKSDDGLNSSNTVNGGLIALVAEEAALSLSPGTTLCSLHLRYLQPVRVGPLVATAQVQHGLGRLELRDAGNDSRLSVVATSRVFPAAGTDDAFGAAPAVAQAAGWGASA